ncbi:hypothetical protein AK812_SmicGene40584 [Symbiodinium microadriaticum]|uniref:Uncharacterized protein n=1 Tax=Symbiodinium microadriaticum TaxID=2951 RepID=A0A1Q9C8G3_SYMMI|nr:hypothetical protein AK812_SmicGene40584 [Symbiodinium microadriaticum]
MAIFEAFVHEQSCHFPWLAETGVSHVNKRGRASTATKAAPDPKKKKKKEKQAAKNEKQACYTDAVETAFTAPLAGLALSIPSNGSIKLKQQQYFMINSTLVNDLLLAIGSILFVIFYLRARFTA